MKCKYCDKVSLPGFPDGEGHCVRHWVTQKWGKGIEQAIQEPKPHSSLVQRLSS